MDAVSRKFLHVWEIGNLGLLLRTRRDDHFIEEERI